MRWCMRRSLFLAACLVVCVLAGTLLYFRSKQYHVIITQTQIDDALRAKFPVSKMYLFIFRITFSNPKLMFRRDEGAGPSRGFDGCHSVRHAIRLFPSVASTVAPAAHVPYL